MNDLSHTKFPDLGSAIVFLAGNLDVLVVYQGLLEIYPDVDWDAKEDWYVTVIRNDDLCFRANISRKDMSCGIKDGQTFYSVDFSRFGKRLSVRAINLKQRSDAAALKESEKRIRLANNGKLPPPPGVLKLGLRSEQKQSRSIASTIVRPLQGGAYGLGKKA